MSAKRYLILVLGLAAALVAGIVAINLAVDPYGIGGAATGRAEGIRDIERPGAFWRKAFAVREVGARTVLLGTSRAAYGLDDRSPAFGADARPVANLALGALSIDQIRLLLIHAHALAPVRMAVIGLDLESFLDEGRPDFDAAALAGNPQSEPEALVRARIALSREALAESLARVRAPQHGSSTSNAPANATALMQDGAGIDVDLRLFDGQRGLIWVNEFGNFYTRLRYLFPRWPAGARWADDRRRAASMRAFRQLLDFARRERIELRLFVSPVHARYLEWYQRVGWWPLFEAWKRSLVDVIEDEARANPGPAPFLLHDFSGYHALAMEAPPPLHDLSSRMRWYRDTSHYSRDVGEMIVGRLLERPATDEPLLPDEVLTRSTIEQQLADIRAGSIAYRRSQPDEAANVTEMVTHLRRVTGK